MKVLVSSIAALILAGTASAQPILPALEDFEDGFSGWWDGNFLPTTPVATGALDGSAYITTALNFAAQGEGDSRTVFRGETGPGTGDASNGMFVGDWIAAGVTQLSFDFYHEAGEPVFLFTRIAAVPRFPGAVAVKFVPVLSHTWTTITFDIDPLNPEFVSFEGTDFNSVFSNVGHIQIGVDTTAGLAGTTDPVAFGLDNVRIIPTPATAGLLGLGVLAGLRRRR